MDDLPALKDLLCNQRGLATRAQLLDLGITPAAVRWRLGRAWRSVLPGVIASFTGKLDPGQRLIAAQLFAGPAAVVSSWTAAGWHGVESARQTPIIRMTVPDHLAARRSGGVVVSRSSRPDESAWERGPLRIASCARAVVDAAREVQGDRRAAAIVIEAVQRRITTIPALRHELEAGPRRGSAQVRKALAAAESGAWSIPEADLVRLLAAGSILPEVWMNPRLSTEDGRRLPTPDAWVDEVGLAVQVHSRTFHARDQDWNGTVTSDSALGEAGIVTIGVTPDLITHQPMSVLRRVERAYSSLRERPRPQVLAVPQAAL